MSSIIVGFSKHKGFAPLGWLIMLCERSSFSHAFISLNADSLDRKLIYQATGAGVNFVGQEVFDEVNQVVKTYNIEISDAARTKLLQWAIDQAGKPYGHLELVGLGLIRFMKLFGMHIVNPFGDGNKAYVCCKLVAAALEDLGLAPPSPLDEVDLNATRDMAQAAEEKSKT